MLVVPLWFVITHEYGIRLPRANGRCHAFAMTVDGLTGCVIVTGAPAAGKSTVSTLAARQLPRAARIKGDDVYEMILAGCVRFNGEAGRYPVLT